jgi:class 3 adenylate cyclase
LYFDTPEQAHRCAAVIHAAAARHNRLKTKPLAKRVFRSGAATGDVDIKQRIGGLKPAGASISHAKRLETNASPGGVLIDEATYEGLTDEQRSTYGPRSRVPGKRDEEFDAYSCDFDAAGPSDAAFFTKQAGAKKENESAGDPFQIVQSDRQGWSESTR